MIWLGVVYALLFYAAAAVLAAGLASRVWRYARAPAPLKIPTMPAPLSRAGAAFRLAREIALFESLFKSNKWLWGLGWLFHAALLVVLLRHLRYFVEPVGPFLAAIQPFGVQAGFVMAAALAGLWLRRLMVERVRYISAPSDHLMLALLIAVAASGLAMKHLARTDIVAVKAFCIGLLRLEPQPLPADPALLVHLGLVAALLIIFPFSKLLHAPGVFFSPTRNQADDARERRHLAPWAARLEAGKRP